MNINYSSIKERFSFDCFLNIPAKKITSYRIGGQIDFLAYPKTEDEFKSFITYCHSEKLSVNILGRGTNVLISDRGIRGIVVSTDKLKKIEISGAAVSVGAGVLWDDFIKLTVKEGFGGLEKTSGIPGSVGGAARMNAGAFGQEVFNRIEGIKVMDFNGKISFLKKADIDYGYRKVKGLDNLIVLAAVFLFEKTDEKDLLKIREDILDQRNAKQPLDYPSAGSVFKRPENDYASRLIDFCGLKGLRIGDAQVSKKHAGFIINTGNATAKDVFTLMNKIKEEVEKKTRIKLELEQILMGNWDI
ncbi:MAG: UDP-N-acetylmuramate dehydrogenase [Elusimicrobiota bacterium]|nr:UDP-N-acetylmuramate dehydrogenase [Elusimicrobiota bacterium]